MCDICDSQAASKHELKEIVDEWAEQWELIVDDPLEISERPASASTVVSQEPSEAPEASASCTRFFSSTEKPATSHAAFIA